MEVLTNAMVVISQLISVSNQHIVYLKLYIMLYMSVVYLKLICQLYIHKPGKNLKKDLKIRMIWQ